MICRNFLYIHCDMAALRGEFAGIGEMFRKICLRRRESLMKCSWITHFNLIENICPFSFKLRLHNTHDVFQQFGQESHILPQYHFTVLYLGHIQDIIDKPEQMLAGKTDFSDSPSFLQGHQDEQMRYLSYL